MQKLNSKLEEDESRDNNRETNIEEEKESRQYNKTNKERITKIQEEVIKTYKEKENSNRDISIYGEHACPNESNGGGEEGMDMLSYTNEGMETVWKMNEDNGGEEDTDNTDVDFESVGTVEWLEEGENRG